MVVQWSQVSLDKEILISWSFLNKETAECELCCLGVLGFVQNVAVVVDQ